MQLIYDGDGRVIALLLRAMRIVALRRHCPSCRRSRSERGVQVSCNLEGKVRPRSPSYVPNQAHSGPDLPRERRVAPSVTLRSLRVLPDPLKRRILSLQQRPSEEPRLKERPLHKEGGGAMSSTVRMVIWACSLGLLPTAGHALEDATVAKLCEPGHIIASHQPPGFDFGTTSWERAEQNVYVYRACVENHDSQSELFVHWYIPKVQGTIAPGDSNTQPRTFPDHKTKSIDGCLIYGNNRHIMKAQFLGNVADSEKADKEGDCSQLRGQQTASSHLDKVPSFIVGGRASFPTDAKDPEHTLIRFVYDVGVQPEGTRYQALFRFAAAPTSPSTFRGDIKSITLRPTNRELREALMTSGSPDGIIQLGKYEGKFDVSLPIPKNFTLGQQTYSVFDRYGNMVGAISTPLLLPVEN